MQLLKVISTSPLLMCDFAYIWACYPVLACVVSVCELLYVNVCSVYVPVWLALVTQTAVSNPETDNVPGWIPQTCVGILIEVYSLSSVRHTGVNKTHQPPCGGWICMTSCPSSLKYFTRVLTLILKHYEESCSGCYEATGPTVYPFVSAEYKMWAFESSFTIVCWSLRYCGCPP